jgi:hypothetical protein
MQIRHPVQNIAKPTVIPGDNRYVLKHISDHIRPYAALQYYAEFNSLLNVDAGILRRTYTSHHKLCRV